MHFVRLVLRVQTDTRVVMTGRRSLQSAALAFVLVAAIGAVSAQLTWDFSPSIGIAPPARYQYSYTLYQV